MSCRSAHAEVQGRNLPRHTQDAAGTPGLCPLSESVRKLVSRRSGSTGITHCCPSGSFCNREASGSPLPLPGAHTSLACHQHPFHNPLPRLCWSCNCFQVSTTDGDAKIPPNLQAPFLGRQRALTAETSHRVRLSGVDAPQRWTKPGEAGREPKEHVLLCWTLIWAQSVPTRASIESTRKQPLEGRCVSGAGVPDPGPSASPHTLPCLLRVLNLVPKVDPNKSESKMLGFCLLKLQLLKQNSADFSSLFLNPSLRD